MGINLKGCNGCWLLLKQTYVDWLFQWSWSGETAGWCCESLCARWWIVAFYRSIFCITVLFTGFFLSLFKLVSLCVMIFIHLVPEKNTFYRVIGFDSQWSQPGISTVTSLLIHIHCKLYSVNRFVSTSGTITFYLQIKCCKCLNVFCMQLFSTSVF